MCSKPKVDDGGQQPITSVYLNGKRCNDFSLPGAPLYSYCRIWVRVGTRRWNSSSHSSSVNPSWSAKFKNTTNRPQFTLEKSSEWSCFNFSRFEPGSLKKFSLSFSIALVDIVKFFAVKRYQENLTRSKERERPILTKISTNTHWRKIKRSTHFITFTNKACFECH